MVTIKIVKVKSGDLNRRIRSLKSFIKEPVKRNIFARHINNMEKHWTSECRKTFTVRRSRGLAVDGLMEKSLGIELRKNMVIVYVKPTQRDTKRPNYSSGGAVRNLTSILFEGTRASFGRYYPPWDCRINVGTHPGISASPMRNMWKRYKLYSDKKIREAMRECLLSELKRK